MKRGIYSVIVVLIGLSNAVVEAQEIMSAGDFFKAQPSADRSVTFDITDPGVSKTVEFGADLAWASEQNFRRAILFMGKDQMDIVRTSFQPTYALVNGQLTTEQMDDLNWRLYLINTFLGPNTDLALNSDHPFVDDSYVGNPAKWEELIQVTTQHYLDAGHNVVTIGVFNEPDFTATGQGSFQDMYDITALLNGNSFFNGVRLSGGNTLNCDEALGWYQGLVPAGVDEGNTHQLAGNFDNFASFFETVRANGHHATADEMHNVMEALVGYEYGMQTGIWWGPAELARGEMVKAFDGERIGYAEHRPNWTAAAVYRTPEGKIQAFGGTSERQAVTTTYKFISKDRAVYYDGYGPQHEFILEMPGGTGYQQGQTNAERVINVTWGDDIQPVVNGRYVLVNRKSNLVLEAAGTTAGSNIRQGTNAGTASQQWDVTPVDARVGGDFSYHDIRPASNGDMSLDLVNFSLDNGANIQQWTAANSGNQQWYLDYAEDGWFYVRSRESSRCLDVSGGSSSPGANVIQWEKNGNQSQQWRLLPVGAPIEFNAPFANPGLEATAQSESVLLEWPANPETDVAGYIILRSTTTGGPYNTIARNVTATAFVDNTVLSGTEYFYVIRTVDNSLNSSGFSNEVSAVATGENGLVAHYSFDEITRDSSVNLNHSAMYGDASFISGKIGSHAISLNGTDKFLQLPASIAHEQEVSVAAWVKWGGGADWQRIFDFGNGETEYMMLTPAAASRMLFTIKYNGTEVTMDAPALTEGEWTHVAVTLEAGYAYLYVNGEPADIAPGFSMSPMEFKPVLNYIGRSQYADPLFSGEIDDFRVYNYSLTPGEVAVLAGIAEPGEVLDAGQISRNLVVWPVPADDVVNIAFDEYEGDIKLMICNLSGEKVLIGDLKSPKIQLDVSSLPDGIYLLQLNNGEKMLIRKIYVSH